MSKQNRERRLANQQSMMMQVARSFSFAGPLPPPDILTKYNEALPGAAERILAMAERQSIDRQELERKVVDSNTFAQKLGPILGFIVAMTAVIGGIVLVLKGKDGYGLAAIIGALASLAGVFIYGKREQRKQLDAKAEEFIKPSSQIAARP